MLKKPTSPPPPPPRPKISLTYIGSRPPFPVLPRGLDIDIDDNTAANDNNSTTETPLSDGTVNVFRISFNALGLALACLLLSAVLIGTISYHCGKCGGMIGYLHDLQNQLGIRWVRGRGGAAPGAGCDGSSAPIVPEEDLEHGGKGGASGGIDTVIGRLNGSKIQYFSLRSLDSIVGGVAPNNINSNNDDTISVDNAAETASMVTVHDVINDGEDDDTTAPPPPPPSAPPPPESPQAAAAADVEEKGEKEKSASDIEQKKK